MLRLLLSKAQGCKDFRKTSEPCYVGIHWKALAEYSQMTTHVPEFRSFFKFFASFCNGKLASSSIRVKGLCCLSSFVCVLSFQVIQLKVAVRQSSDATKQAAQNKYNFHSSLFSLWMMLFILHAPQLIVWAKNLP